jgi:hypothetical protein
LPPKYLLALVPHRGRATAPITMTLVGNLFNFLAPAFFLSHRVVLSGHHANTVLKEESMSWWHMADLHKW